jgi:aspartate ammonia-lyase
VVDVLQGGAGTSTNMNANEVIANRALELLGQRLGEYRHLDPIEHVNLGQSTNDVYPTALRLALRVRLGELRRVLATLRESLLGKGMEFGSVVKMGRTQLQEAVPMALGREFTAFGITFRDDLARLDQVSEALAEVNLGGTAIGTGINAHPKYASTACRRLAELARMPVRPTFDLVEATQDAGAYVEVSGVLRRLAVKLSKLCNDLRLLSSGPVSGFGEITLPPMQSGSSIMPGKVNPVIPEVVNQIAFDVIGADVTVTMGAEAGQLQLNAFLPVIAHRLLSGTAHLTAGCQVLNERCVRGISANAERLRESVARSPGVVTALTPALGVPCASGAVSSPGIPADAPLPQIRHIRDDIDARIRALLDDIINP